MSAVTTHYVSSYGSPLALLFIPLMIGAVVLPLWAICHALSTPRASFESLDRSKTKWVVWMALLLDSGYFVGFIVAIYYLRRVRPDLNRVTL